VERYLGDIASQSHSYTRPLFSSTNKTAKTDVDKAAYEFAKLLLRRMNELETSRAELMEMRLDLASPKQINQFRRNIDYIDDQLELLDGMNSQVDKFMNRLDRL
jgi:hypothetical protein